MGWENGGNAHKLLNKDFNTVGSSGVFFFFNLGEFGGVIAQKEEREMDDDVEKENKK